jgi:RHS repeat-associated protein
MACPILECVSAIVRRCFVCSAKSTNPAEDISASSETIDMSVRTIFGAILTVVLIIGSASAQTGQGQVPFGTATGGQYDTINLANLSIQVHAPLHSKAGLLPLSYGFSVDDFVGIAGGTSANGPGPIFTMGASGVFGMGVFPTSGPVNAGECSDLTYWYTYNGFYLLDNVGNYHSVPLNVTVSNGVDGSSGCNGTTASAYATDGSGYNLQINGSTGVATITDVDGNSQSTVVAFDGMIYLIGTADYSYWSNFYICALGSSCPAQQVVTLTDRNGNSMTSTATTSGGYQQAFTDSLEQPALTVKGTPEDGGSNNYTTLTWPNAGGTSTATVNNQYVLIGTNWTGCSGQPKENELGQEVPISVTFADTSTLSIGWEEAQGITYNDGTVNPYYTGRVSSVTIPSGAAITYAYSGGTDSVNCSDGTPNTMTRTTPDGTWTYVHTPGTSPNSTTTVTDPAGNQSVYTFSGQYQTLLKVYSGAVSGGTLLQTVQTCYNNNCSAAATPPFTQIDVYTTLAGQSVAARNTVFYNAYGLPTEVDNYLNSTVLAKKTLTTYGNWTGSSCSALGGNLLSRVCQTQVYAGSTLAAQNVYSYNSSGDLLSSGIWNGQTYLTTTYTVSSNGTPATATSPLGLVTTFGYSCNSGMVSSALTNLPSALSTSSVIDCVGALPQSVTDPNGNVTSVNYGSDPLYRPVSEKDAQNNTTSFSYAAGGVSTTTTYPTSTGATNTEAVYTDTLGRENNSQVLDGSSYDTNSIYRQWGSGVGFETKTPLTCSSSEDALCPLSTGGGIQVIVTEPTTTTVYDPLGRPTSSTTISCVGFNCQTYSSTSYSYYPATVSGNNVSDVLVSTTGASKNFEYDALGRLTSVCEVSAQSGSGACGQAHAVNGFLTTYAYNILGDITSVTQGAQTRSFSYDMLRRLTSETNPESGTTNYLYDTATFVCTTAYPGKLVRKADANENFTCPQYDLMGRMIGITYSGPNAGPSSYFVYDAASYNGTAMTNAKGHIAEAYTCTTCSPTPTKITDEYFSYDTRGQLNGVWESTPHSNGYYQTTAGYFPNFILSSLTVPGAVSNLAYALDSKGRPDSATANSGATSLVSSTSYNPADEPLTVSLGLGDTDSFLYDGAYRPGNFTYAVGSAGTTVAGILGYNSGNGTVGSLQITDGFNTAASETCSYSYDDMLRPNGDNCGSAWAQTFSYDRYGNITKSGSLSFNPGYNSSTNRYSSSFAYATYDNNGNLTDDGTSGCGGGAGDCYTYKYDANNYVVSVTTSSGTTNVIRDAFGRTVEIAGTPTTEILYSPAGKTAIMSGANAQAVFAQLPGGSEMEYRGGSYLFHHKDWLDSSRFISIRGSRSMYFDTAYAPFGENYVPSGTTDLDFTGERQDVVAGLYDFQYREYNPNQGRWLSPDPAGNGAVDPSDPQSWNRYSYVQNSALSKTDPLGLMAAASGDGEFRIEGVDIPSYIFAELAGGVAGALVNCYGWCDQINKTVPAPNSPTSGVTYTLVVGADGPVWINNKNGEEIDDPTELGLSDLGDQGPQLGAANNGTTPSTGCSVSGSCGPTANTHGFSHCSVTVNQNGKYTTYDGGPTGSIWNSTLQVQSGPSGPPGPNSFYITDSCSMAGCVPRVAQQINDANMWYSFPFQNSNTAAGMMLNQCGANVSLPVWGPQ